MDLNESVDTDSDGIGNNADTDDDNDGVLDSDDIFSLDASESVDTDSDGIGNNADTDDDNDGIPDESDDLPLDLNESVDTDSDGIGNNADTDDDNDGVLDSDDLFPLDASESIDADSDGIGNNADAFPLDDTESVDTDLDGIGNNADTDDDDDGIQDIDDRYPLLSIRNILSYEFSGQQESLIIPDGIDSIEIKAYGAQGGDPDFGGLGGYVYAQLAVESGETLALYVGGAGYGHDEDGLNGYNGGGFDGAVLAGGGASDIRLGGNSLSDRVLVAGGGGQRGYSNGVPIFGGPGGDLEGGVGEDAARNTTAGQGGSQSAGGIGGCGTVCGGSGGLGIGGSGTDDNGHGGGGYYGGGAGGSSIGILRGGGGGGSSFASEAVAYSVLFNSGANSGDGRIIITIDYNDNDNDGWPDECVDSCIALGMEADSDDDNDGVLDSDDAFPLDATESVDTDSDGIGNNADTDDDNDGILDSDDPFPLDALGM